MAYDFDTKASDCQPSYLADPEVQFCPFNDTETPETDGMEGKFFPEPSSSTISGVSE